MGDLLRVLFVALATFQVCRWIVVETGPLDLFERMREKIGKVTHLVRCSYCVGFWVGAVLFFLWPVNEAHLAILFLAALGVHSLIQLLAARLSTYG